MNNTPFPELLVGKLVYVASPYSDPSALVMENRIREYKAVDAYLLSKGVITVSPLDKIDAIQDNKYPVSTKFWKKYYRELMDNCQDLVVIKLPGWDKSKGICEELDMWGGNPFWYFDPDTFLLSSSLFEDNP